ncbi:MAG: hypothetical protein GC155_03845 [Alphaproteobacteria bacterium]|nr:hypothetical protein [Alphaproteobacteria bacterium]
MTAVATAPNVESLAATLRRIARERPSLDVAQFRVIGLEEIQAAYGADWPVHRDRVRLAAHEYILKRLGEGDLLVRGGDGFLVVFGSIGGREAEIEALSLTHGLNEFFLGEEGAELSPRFVVETREVPLAELSSVLNQAEVDVSPDAVQLRAPDPSDINWLFEPEWDVRGEAVVGYKCAGVVRSTGKSIPGYRFEPIAGRLPSLAHLDIAALKHSDEALRSLVSNGMRARITTKLHVTSLTNGPTRAKIVRALEQLDRDLLRFRAIRICGVTPGFPRIYLEDVINQLRRAVSYVAVGAVWNEPDMLTLLQSNASSVGFCLPPAPTGPGCSAPQQDLLARARTAVALAAGQKKPFFVDGPFSRDLAIRLSAIGVTQMSSKEIWPAVPEPAPMQAWTADRLFTR